VPTGPDWLHEVKYDGYRMMLIRKQDRVRLISRGNYDLTRHFPLIVEAAVVLGPDDVSNFAALKSGQRNEQAHLYAFDTLAGDGEDHRRLPLSLRKANLDPAALAPGGRHLPFPTTSKARSVAIYSTPPAACASKNRAHPAYSR